MEEGQKDRQLILFRPSRPDFIETGTRFVTQRRRERLFRPSRPDFIEIHSGALIGTGSATYCSGLLGRTSLRSPQPRNAEERDCELFRPSRPDFIEILAMAYTRETLEAIVPAF